MCAQTCEVIYVGISLSGRAYGRGVFLQLLISLNNAAQLYGQKRKAVRRLVYLWFEAGGFAAVKILALFNFGVVLQYSDGSTVGRIMKNYRIPYATI